MSSTYSGGAASLGETLQQGMGGFGVVINAGPETITSPFAADSFTVHNLSDSFVRITLQLAAGIDPTTVRGPGGPGSAPQTVVAPGAVYSAAFAERNLVGGLTLELVQFPGVTQPAPGFALGGTGPAYLLVDFVET